MGEKIRLKNGWYIRPRSIAWYVYTFFSEIWVLFAVLGLVAVLVAPAILGAIIADCIGF